MLQTPTEYISPIFRDKSVFDTIKKVKELYSIILGEDLKFVIRNNNLIILSYKQSKVLHFKEVNKNEYWFADQYDYVLKELNLLEFPTYKDGIKIVKEFGYDYNVDKTFTYEDYGPWRFIFKTETTVFHLDG